MFVPTMSPADNSSTPAEGENDELSPLGSGLDLGMILVSAILIGLSLIFKKKALQRLQHRGATRAGDGGYGYLKDRVWWAGLLTMAAGDVATFVQYIFFSAEMVTYLGSFTFIICAIVGPFLLGEKLNHSQKIGCMVCITGSMILFLLVYPHEKELASVQEMTEKLLKPGLLVYVLLVLVVLGLILIAASCFGRTHILVYPFICSLLGAFTMLFAKGLTIILKSSVHDSAMFAKLLPWILSFLVSKLVQEDYLNKSLDIFNTQIVYSIYYALSTFMKVCTAVILFSEWNSISTFKMVMMVCFLICIVLGIFMINDFESLDAESPPSSARCLRRPGAATGRSYSGSGG